MKSIADTTGFKKWILILSSYFTFCVANYNTANVLFSSNSLFLSILIVFGYSLIYYILFEVLVGLFFIAQRNKVSNFIGLRQFSNIFRFLIIFVNIILYILTKLFIFLNFYSVYFLIIFTIFAYFIMFVVGYKVLRKNFVQNSFASVYYGYSFIFLALLVILWGVL